MSKPLAIAIALLTCFSFSPIALGNDKESRRLMNLEIDRQIIESSPVLRKWLDNPPDLLDDIYNIPSFNTKLRVGLTSRDNSFGIEAGVEDLFVGQSPFTISGAYQGEFSGRESELQANLRYYLFPLGSYWNVAPIAGYRQFNQFARSPVSGLDVGLMGILVLSPRSSELRLSHTFTSPNGDLELSTTTLSTSYALSRNLRLGTKIEWRRSPIVYDSRVGFLLELAL